MRTLVVTAVLAGCSQPVPVPAEQPGESALVSQDAYLKASNTGADDLFGSATAIAADGRTLVVGAPFEDSDGEAARDSGAVYVYARAGSLWSHEAYLKASNATGDDNFGWAVAVSGDGATIAVGAPGEDSGGAPDDDSVHDSGAVYVFARTATGWAQQAYLKASDPVQIGWVGRALSLSHDGSTLAVGGERVDDGSGAVYVFARTGTTWSQQARLKAASPDAGDRFGISVSLNADASTLVIGAALEASAATGVGGSQTDDSAPSSGAVYVFERAGTFWVQASYLKASNTEAGDAFGISVGLSGDGSTIAVGAYLESSAATGVGGDQTSNAKMWSGAVYVFARVATSWVQDAYIKASNTGADDTFGFALALSDDGARLAVGSHQESSGSTGIDGDQANNAKHNAGAAYLFERETGRVHQPWHQTHYVKASNTGANDELATSLALSSDGTTLALGAPGEASAATGVGGDQSSNAAPSSGAAYVYAAE